MCQLQYIDEIGQKNNWFNDRLQYSIRKFRYYRRRTLQSLHTANNTGKTLQLDPEQIQPGDMVRVRSKAEIKHILNPFRKSGGCTFQIGMYDCCEKEYRVFKKVDYFFDEARQRMCKCKNIFLLEGACCNGATAYLKACDRNCFFFWHSNWLKKV